MRKIFCFLLTIFCINSQLLMGMEELSDDEDKYPPLFFDEDYSAVLKKYEKLLDTISNAINEALSSLKKDGSSLKKADFNDAIAKIKNKIKHFNERYDATRKEWTTEPYKMTIIDGIAIFKEMSSIGKQNNIQLNENLFSHVNDNLKFIETGLLEDYETHQYSEENMMSLFSEPSLTIEQPKNNQHFSKEPKKEPENYELQIFSDIHRLIDKKTVKLEQKPTFSTNPGHKEPHLVGSHIFSLTEDQKKYLGDYTGFITNRNDDRGTIFYDEPNYLQRLVEESPNQDFNWIDRWYRTVYTLLQDPDIKENVTKILGKTDFLIRKLVNLLAFSTQEQIANAIKGEGEKEVDPNKLHIALNLKEQIFQACFDSLIHDMQELKNNSFENWSTNKKTHEDEIKKLNSQENLSDEERAYLQNLEYFKSNSEKLENLSTFFYTFENKNIEEAKNLILENTEEKKILLMNLLKIKNEWIDENIKNKVHSNYDFYKLESEINDLQYAIDNSKYRCDQIDVNCSLFNKYKSKYSDFFDAMPKSKESTKNFQERLESEIDDLLKKYSNVEENFLKRVAGLIPSLRLELPYQTFCNITTVNQFKSLLDNEYKKELKKRKKYLEDIGQIGKAKEIVIEKASINALNFPDTYFQAYIQKFQNIKREIAKNTYKAFDSTTNQWLDKELDSETRKDKTTVLQEERLEMVIPAHTELIFLPIAFFELEQLQKEEIKEKAKLPSIENATEADQAQFQEKTKNISTEYKEKAQQIIDGCMQQLQDFAQKYQFQAHSKSDAKQEMTIISQMVNAIQKEYTQDDLKFKRFLEEQLEINWENFDNPKVDIQRLKEEKDKKVFYRLLKENENFFNNKFLQQRAVKIVQLFENCENNFLLQCEFDEEHNNKYGPKIKENLASTTSKIQQDDILMKWQKERKRILYELVENPHPLAPVILYPEKDDMKLEDVPQKTVNDDALIVAALIDEGNPDLIKDIIGQYENFYHKEHLSSQAKVLHEIQDWIKFFKEIYSLTLNKKSFLYDQQSYTFEQNKTFTIDLKKDFIRFIKWTADSPAHLLTYLEKFNKDYIRTEGVQTTLFSTYNKQMKDSEREDRMKDEQQKFLGVYGHLLTDIKTEYNCTFQENDNDGKILAIGLYSNSTMSNQKKINLKGSVVKYDEDLRKAIFHIYHPNEASEPLAVGEVDKKQLKHPLKRCLDSLCEINKTTGTCLLNNEDYRRFIFQKLNQRDHTIDDHFDIIVELCKQHEVYKGDIYKMIQHKICFIPEKEKNHIKRTWEKKVLSINEWYVKRTELENRLSIFKQSDLFHLLIKNEFLAQFYSKVSNSEGILSNHKIDKALPLKDDKKLSQEIAKQVDKYTDCYFRKEELEAFVLMIFKQFFSNDASITSQLAQPSFDLCKDIKKIGLSGFLISFGSLIFNDKTKFDELYYFFIYWYVTKQEIPENPESAGRIVNNLFYLWEGYLTNNDFDKDTITLFLAIQRENLSEDRNVYNYINRLKTNILQNIHEKNLQKTVTDIVNNCKDALLSEQYVSSIINQWHNDPANDPLVFLSWKEYSHFEQDWKKKNQNVDKAFDETIFKAYIKEKILNAHINKLENYVAFHTSLPKSEQSKIPFSVWNDTLNRLFAQHRQTLSNLPFNDQRYCIAKLLKVPGLTIFSNKSVAETTDFILQQPLDCLLALPTYFYEGQGDKNETVQWYGYRQYHYKKSNKKPVSIQEYITKYHETKAFIFDQDEENDNTIFNEKAELIHKLTSVFYQGLTDEDYNAIKQYFNEAGTKTQEDKIICVNSFLTFFHQQAVKAPELLEEKGNKKKVLFRQWKNDFDTYSQKVSTRSIFSQKNILQENSYIKNNAYIQSRYNEIDQNLTVPDNDYIDEIDKKESAKQANINQLALLNQFILDVFVKYKKTAEKRGISGTHYWQEAMNFWAQSSKDVSHKKTLDLYSYMIAHSFAWPNLFRENTDLLHFEKKCQEARTILQNLGGDPTPEEVHDLIFINWWEKLYEYSNNHTFEYYMGIKDSLMERARAINQHKYELGGECQIHHLAKSCYWLAKKILGDVMSYKEGFEFVMGKPSFPEQSTSDIYAYLATKNKNDNNHEVAQFFKEKIFRKN